MFEVLAETLSQTELAQNNLDGMISPPLKHGHPLLEPNFLSRTY